MDTSNYEKNMTKHDWEYYLNPFTNLQSIEQDGPMVITKGEGIYVYDQHGKQYIEGLSGLWCVSLGFSEKRLMEAAQRQLETLPYYHSFGGKAPDCSLKLAERLMQVAPKQLSRVIFANSGSESNDTAVKIAWYYNNALGRTQKKKIISRFFGYHGVTIISGSMTGMSYAQEGFDLPLPVVLHADCPHHYRYSERGESEESFADRMAANLEKLILSEGPETIAAFIAEPVQGAGGVIVPPTTYFEKVQAVLRKYDILMIADEVICGFARTGQMFGSQTFNIVPDMMTVAKQLSSGYQPISALIISDSIYDALRDQSQNLGLFGHGFTYSGHPVPAAVALETLRIYEELDIVSRVGEVSPRLQQGLQEFQHHPLVGHVRGVGLVAAVELIRDKSTKEPFDPSEKVGAYLVQRAQEHGLIIRALPGDCVAFCPPLIVSEQEIDQIIERFGHALQDTTKAFA